MVFTVEVNNPGGNKSGFYFAAFASKLGFEIIYASGFVKIGDNLFAVFGDVPDLNIPGRYTDDIGPGIAG